MNFSEYVRHLIRVQATGKSLSAVTASTSRTGLALLTAQKKVGTVQNVGTGEWQVAPEKT